MDRRIGGLAAAALLLVSLGAGDVRAQDAGGIRQDPLNLQQQRYQDRQRELRRITPPAGGVEVQPGRGAPAAGGPCRTIRRIAIDGAAAIPSRELAAATDGFVGRCLNLADLDQVVDAVNAAYVDRGYVTSRAYLPEQDLTTGILKVVVLEGRVQGIVLDGRDGTVPATAFPGLAGEVLNLRDLEQGLDQINRLPSWNAKMRISPGAEAGTSQVIIAAPPGEWPLQGWLRGSAFMENSGAAETGHEVGHIAVAADDLLGLLDSWSVEYQRSLVPFETEHLSNAVSVNLSVPYGYWTVFTGYSYSDYRYRVAGQTQDFGLSGRSQRFSAGINRVLYRNQDSKVAAELGYELKRTESDLEDVRLRTGTQDLAAISGRLSWSGRLWDGVWYTTLGLKRGLGDLGTDLSLPANGGSDAPHAEYWQPSLDIDGFQPVRIGSVGLMWHPSLHAEYADRTLYGTDRLFLGGIYTVRGFGDTSLLGDRGAYLRNDVSWSLPATGDALSDQVFAGPELYVGLDAGWTGTATGRASGGPGEGTLAGTAIGIRNTSGYAIADLSVARSIARSGLSDEGLMINLNLGVRF